MDPWLEHPAVWPGFHQIFIVDAAAQLQPRLRQRGYYVDIGERVWLAEPGRPILPDLVVEQALSERSRPTVAIRKSHADQPIHIERTIVEIKEIFLEIFETATHRLITGIELLSPTNKRDRTGRRLYRRKQREAAEAGIHLVEIDLLRLKPHLLDFPKPILEELPEHSYLVHIGRRWSSDYEIYAIKLRESLPKIVVPLKQDDEDGVLDLQRVMDESYEKGPYPEKLMYGSPAKPRLTGGDAKWADQLLREKGFRK
jgi:hypothetical protein